MAVAGLPFLNYGYKEKNVSRGVELCCDELLLTWQNQGRFPHVLHETEHFCGRPQKEVAKIVHCGETLAKKK
jgi:hypothetical protein